MRTIVGVVSGAASSDTPRACRLMQHMSMCEGDSLAAAQDVVINGVVGDDVRAFAQVVHVGPHAQLRGDLAVGVLSLESPSGSVITGDLLVAADQALLADAVGHTILGGLLTKLAGWMVVEPVATPAGA